LLPFYLKPEGYTVSRRPPIMMVICAACGAGALVLLVTLWAAFQPALDAFSAGLSTGAMEGRAAEAAS
jgi:hypothetical protein